MKDKKLMQAMKGNLVHSTAPDHLEIFENSYLVYEGNIVKGIYGELPKEYAGIPVEDYGDRLIIPGLVDLHVHAPQYSFRGAGNGHGTVGLAEYQYLSGRGEIWGYGICPKSV